MKTHRITFSILGAAALAASSSLLLPRMARAGTELFSAQDVDAWNKALPQAAPTFKTRELGGTRGVDADTGPSCHSIPKADVPAAPTINIVSPSLGKPLAAPLDIDVKFVATDGDSIQPNTFKVCYLARFMTIDITDKIVDKVTVLPDGLHVPGAQLPSGHHHLMMLIGDKGGHVGRREAIFDIQ
jgi:hypothetical protein